MHLLHPPVSVCIPISQWTNGKILGILKLLGLSVLYSKQETFNLQANSQLTLFSVCLEKAHS